MDAFCSEQHTLVGNFAVHDDYTLCVEASTALIEASRASAPSFPPASGINPVAEIFTPET